MDLNCRVCLEIRDVMVDIFDEVDQFHTDLASLLENCGGMLIELEDPYPKYICQECTQELLVVAEFREKCKLAPKLWLEIQQKAAEEHAMSEQTEETIMTTEHVQKENPSSESTVLYEPVVVDDENFDMGLTDYTLDNAAKLDAVEINIVFENDPNNTAAITASANDDASNIGNVIQLVLPKDAQCGKHAIEEALTEVDVVASDSEEVYDSVEFADSIIEVLENEETELSAEQIGNAYPTTSLKSTQNYNFICKACGACFMKAANLRRHMEIAHNAFLEYSCETCHRNFETEKDYKRHADICAEEIRNSSTEPTPKVSQNKKKASQTAGQHICDYCGKCLQSLFSLRMHVRTHTGERPFSCNKCDSKFKTQGGLTTHAKRHEGNADLICEVCEKRFIDPTNLIAHRRTHTGVRPHACTVCNQMFTRVYLLQLHMRTHTGERPFQCEYCLKTFSQSADLKYHMAVHNDDRKYSCPMCPKTFIRRGKLEVHMDKHSHQLLQGALHDDTTHTEENTTFTNIQNDLDMDVVNVNDDYDDFS